MAVSTKIRRWLAFGTGVAIEISGDDLHVLVTRVRPTGSQILGSATIEKHAARPASEWGAEYAAFTKKLGAGHIAAAVLLPRSEIIVRQLNLPGVPDKDLEAAIALQVDSLHPYPEDDVVYAWARLGSSSSILIGIARRETVDRYASLFAEAGIKTASFTFSAAAIYSAIRLLSSPPANGFAVVRPFNGSVEIYGESEARPVFSAEVCGSEERARTLALAELRLEPDSETGHLRELLPLPKDAPPEDEEYRRALGERALPYAVSLAGACPRLALAANLLPAGRRSTSSRLMYVPTIFLGVLLLLLLSALAVHGKYQERRYLSVLEAEIAKFEPRARQVAALDRDTRIARQRTVLLDNFRRRSKLDMDVVNELTKLLAPPIWVSQLEVTRTFVHIAGEAEQAAPLLKVLDESPLFQDSQFTMPLGRTGTGEVFRIRTTREGLPE